ncbi:MAG: adenosine deaminase [Tatlockia sp.]|nr:adenosine deaminase [Tatlockia sp.]
MIKKFLCLCSAWLIATFVFALTPEEIKTQRYFESIKTKPEELYTLLKTMPKGGDLHNHLSGASYAEKMIRYAENDHLCLNTKTYAVFTKTDCDKQSLLDAKLLTKKELHDKLIKAWSMRNFNAKNESGHDHFFAVFGKFSAISNLHQGEMLAEIISRAGRHNESYLEIMATVDNNASGKLAKRLGWDADFNKMRSKLFAHGFEKIIKQMSKQLDQNDKTVKTLLLCDSNQPKTGCEVKFRYLYQALREQAPEMVFAQLLAGFEIATQDNRVLGLNLVQAEDGLISMRDYTLHMQMIAFLHQIYPKVPYSLHAGELTKTLAGSEGVKFHINQAVNLAKAQRIGHGVDIAQEDNAAQLLKTMADQDILVEINLSSNALILQIKGENHPLPLYMHYGVPLTLSTDDEGVNRSNLSKEYKQAAQAFNLNYATLKNFARNSLSYSFLPGEKLWLDKNYQTAQQACQNDPLGTETPTQQCLAFLKSNEKAALQWDLEKRFNQFENKFS